MQRLPLKVAPSIALETPIPILPDGHAQEDADMKMTRRMANAALLVFTALALTGCQTLAQEPSGDYVYCHGMKRPPGWICADPK